MSTLLDRVATLSTEKRQLLVRRLDPLSFIQERLWFLHQLAPGVPVYNVPLPLLLTGRLDIGRLARSLAIIETRHEILRTSFPAIDGQPVQHVARPAGAPIRFVDLERVDVQSADVERVDVERVGAPRQDAERKRVLDREVRRVFDVEHGPLWRRLLVRLAPDRHVLLITWHHLVYDGWSRGVFLAELTALYVGLADGRPFALAPLPTQYRHFARAQRGALHDRAIDEQLTYWRTSLGDDVPVLQLPADRTPPVPRTYRGADELWTLPQPLAAGLEAIGQEDGVTLFMALMAGWALLLHKYSRCRDVVIGTASSGRMRREYEGLIGCFVNTLALRVSLAGNPTVRELLARVRELTLGAFAHQDVPFERIVSELQPERRGDQMPLFQTSLTLQNLPGGPRAGGGRATADQDLVVDEVATADRTASIDLALGVMKTPDGVIGPLRYATDLFDRATIVRLLGHFTQVLRQMVEPDGRIADVSLPTPSERTEILTRWNETAQVVSDDAIADVFDGHADRQPDAIAVVHADRQLTYGALLARANQLARELAALGVGREHRVGVMLPRSLDLMAAPLAIWKAGAAYLPLDPEYPPDRLAFMIEDGRPSVIVSETAIVHGRSLGAIERAGIPLLCVDRVPPPADRDTTHRPRVRVGATDAAYVIYTSGSTGRPKGVVVSHAGIASLAASQAARLNVTHASRILQFASLSFDASAWEIVMALSAGAALIVAPDEARAGTALQDELMTNGVTHATLPPVVLATLTADSTLPTTTLIVAGEACRPALVAQWGRGRTLINAYGPTETTVCATMSGPLMGGEAPIGTPIIDTRVYVLDPGMQPAPIGVAGALLVAGLGLARGYWQRPELTAERFIPDPFGPPGGRMYRTGDLARWRADGQLDFVGRADQQVKLRGHRIELGEIETALRQQPGVRDAAVLLREDAPGERRLVAYVASGDAAAGQPHEGDRQTDRAFDKIDAIDPDALIQRLRHLLPPALVPAEIVELSVFPLTPAGKVDRRRLPAPKSMEARSAAAAAYTAPRTDAEAALARVWADVLRIERVGVHDNFFALGGDSILSLQIVARALQAGWRLTPRQIFEAPTVAALATLAQPASTSERTVGPFVGAVPLLPMQSWFFESHPPSALHHYNQQVLFELVPPPPVRILDRAWAALLAHHDALRVRFTRVSTVDDVRWTQDCAPPGGGGRGAPPRMPTIDLQQIAGPSLPSVWTRVASAVQGSLHLEHGPLTRPVLLIAPGRATHLFIVAHHLVIDGVSWRVLLGDLQGLCRQLQRGETPALPPRTASIRQWADALHAFAASESLAQETGFWLRMSEPAALLPREASEVGTAIDAARTTRTHALTFERDETAALIQELPGRGVGHAQELLLAAFVQALAAWTGEQAWRIDLEGHGREGLPGDGVDVSRTVGWFTALYPVRLVAGADLLGTLRAVKTTLRNVPRHGLGYGVLRYMDERPEAVPIRTTPSRAEIVFNYLGQVDQVLDAGGWMRPAPWPVGAARHRDQPREYAVEVNSIVRGGRLQVAWNVGGSQRPETIEALAEAFRASARALVAAVRADEARSWLVPADFPLAVTTQDEIARLTTQGSIVDLYPLSPMQQGLLFHTIYGLDRSMLYTIQFQTRIDGALDVETFRQAWEDVIARHDILRTGFVWKRAGAPLQAVHGAVEMPCSVQDWRALPAVERQARCVSYAAAEQRRGFDLERPPLMRVAVLRLKDEEWQVVWTAHHLVLDGWSGPIVLDDVLRTYRDFASGRPARPIAASGRYRDYIAWVQRQDMGKAEAFWRRTLDGFSSPSLLATEPRRTIHETVARQTIGTVIPPDEVQRIEQIGRARALTPNSWLTAAWALLLAQQTRRRDVVFGGVVSGRPPHLPDIERMVGMFTNTLPVRATLDPVEPIASWVARLQRQQTDARDYDFSSLAQVQSWSAVPAGTPLFDTLFVYENYPREDEEEREQDQGQPQDGKDERTVGDAMAGADAPASGDAHLRRSTAQASVPISYPVQLLVQPSRAGLATEVTFDPSSIGVARARGLLDAFNGLVDRMTASADTTVGECLDWLAERERGQRAQARERMQARGRARLDRLRA